MSKSHHEKECARLARLVSNTADMLIRRVRSETPAANEDLLEQWVGALHLALKHADNPQALQFAQDTYRLLHAANHPPSPLRARQG